MNILLPVVLAAAVISDAKCGRPRVCADLELRVLSCAPLGGKEKASLLEAEETRRTLAACDAGDAGPEPRTQKVSPGPRRFIVADCSAYERDAAVRGRELKACCDTGPRGSPQCRLNLPSLGPPGPYCEGKPLALEGIVKQNVIAMPGYDLKAVISGKILGKDEREGALRVVEVTLAGARLTCKGRPLALSLMTP